MPKMQKSNENQQKEANYVYVTKRNDPFVSVPLVSFTFDVTMSPVLCLTGPARSGSVWVPFRGCSGSALGPFGVRVGFVRDPLGIHFRGLCRVRSESVRDPKPAAAKKIRSPATAPSLPTADTGFYMIYLLHNLM